MKLISTLVSVFLIALPLSSTAGTQASSVRTSQGTTFLMCSAETTSDVPCNDGSGDIFAFTHGFDSLTFLFSETGSGATCNAYAMGHYNGTSEADPVSESDLESFTTDSLFSTPLSAANSRITLEGTDFNFVWVICSTIDTNVTVEMRGSKKNHDSRGR